LLYKSFQANSGKFEQNILPNLKKLPAPTPVKTSEEYSEKQQC